MPDLLKRNKKGSFTVFATMIFAAVLIAAVAAVNAAVGVSYKGAVNSLGKVWGKSILGEYDLFLKERYGIFGFYGNDHSTGEKLKVYADYSFAGKERVEAEDIRADAEKYSLDKTGPLKEQIKDAVSYGAEPKSYGTPKSYGGPKFYETPKSSSGGKGALGTSSEARGKIYEKTEDRYIKSKWIEKNLPSYGKTGKLYLTELVNKITDGGIGELAGQLAVDRYILKFFKNHVNGGGLGETYFSCETEYIISGKLNDKDSRKNVRSKIKTARNMLNLYYLYSCEEKRQATLALAQLATPGAAAYLTQAVIMETWAYMEAENDMDILYSGETVPLLKKDSNWALSLENVFKSDGGGVMSKTAGTNAGSERAGGGQTGGQAGNDAGGGFIRPQEIEGEDYEDYLGVLLLGLTEETKLLRIADLIQINGKYLYCDSFLMKDYCSGLEYGIKVNGHEKSFEEHY